MALDLHLKRYKNSKRKVPHLDTIDNFLGFRIFFGKFGQYVLELQSKGISMLWNPEESHVFAGQHPPECQSN